MKVLSRLAPTSLRCFGTYDLFFVRPLQKTKNSIQRVISSLVIDGVHCHPCARSMFLRSMTLLCYLLFKNCSQM